MAETRRKQGIILPRCILAQLNFNYGGAATVAPREVAEAVNQPALLKICFNPKARMRCIDEDAPYPSVVAVLSSAFSHLERNRPLLLLESRRDREFHAPTRRCALPNGEDPVSRAGCVLQPCPPPPHKRESRNCG